MRDGAPDREFDKHLHTLMFFKQAQAARRTKRLLQQALLIHAIGRRRRLVILVCLIAHLFFVFTQ